MSHQNIISKTEESANGTTRTESQVQSLLSQRGSVYGLPEANLGLAAYLKAEYRSAVAVHGEFWGGELGSRRAHDEAVEMSLLKIARIATGVLHLDNYDDAIGYLTLAKQMAEKEMSNNAKTR